MESRLRFPTRWWVTSLVLLALGTTVSAYLFARTLALLDSSHPRLPDLCASFLAASCDPFLLDRGTWILGVPIAGWSLVHFTMVAGLLCLARLLRQGFAGEALLSASLLTVIATLVGSIAAFATFREQGSSCYGCLLVLAVDLMLVVTLLRSGPIPIRSSVALLQAGWRWLSDTRPGSPLVRWKLLAVASVVLVGIVAYQWLYVETTLHHAASDRALGARAHAEARIGPSRELPIDADEPRLGSLDAPIRMVVFASFQCPACRNFMPTLSRLHARFGDRVLIAFKHYPLSAQCNPRLAVDQQPGSCQVSWAAEAAHRQGRFWEFSAALCRSDGWVEERLIARTIQGLDLDRGRFEAERWQDATIDRVAKDIELGNRLEIPGTPAVFVDGRLVRRTDTSTLISLLEDVLTARGQPMVQEHALRGPTSADSRAAVREDEVVGDDRRAP